MSSTSTWVYVSRYRLKANSLEDYLKGQFPQSTIKVEVRNLAGYSMRVSLLW